MDGPGPASKKLASRGNSAVDRAVRSGMPVTRVISSVAALFRSRSRRVAVSPTRAHVEFREATPPQIERLAAAMQRIGASLGELSWVEVNADTQRVVFAFEHGAYGPEELCEAVEKAEREAGLDAARFSEDRRSHPADEHEALRRVVELLSDTAAFVFGLGLRFSPLPALPFGGNLVALLSLVQSVPRLKAGLERRLGHERADFVLNLVSSLAQGLAQRPFNSFVDALHTLALHAEVRSRRELWGRRETDLCKAPVAGAPPKTPRRARPGARPPRALGE
jgi:hypothetical protein